MVVAPALARTRLEHWLTSDLERRQERGARAAGRLAPGLHGGGPVRAAAHLGDADPLQALDDALRVFDPDEVVISTHPPQRSNWLERQVVRRARERYALPITHVVVDLEHESVEPRRGRPPAVGAPASAGALRVFHASDYDEAMAIQSGGFRDRPPPGDGAPGVWVTDRPPPPARRATSGWSSPSTCPRRSSPRYEREAGDGGPPLPHAGRAAQPPRARPSPRATGPSSAPGRGLSSRRCVTE